MSDPSLNSNTLWGDILAIADFGRPSLYVEGNLGFHRTSNSEPEENIVLTDWNETFDSSKVTRSTTRYPAPSVTEFDADQLEEPLLANVGALLPQRDSVDTRLVSQVRNREGHIVNCVSQDDRPGDSRCDNNLGGWPFMSTGEPRLDSDDDGIPDEWEIEFGLDPNSQDSLEDRNNDGYTNLEDWIHSLQP